MRTIKRHWGWSSSATKGIQIALLIVLVALVLSAASEGWDFAISPKPRAIFDTTGKGDYEFDFGVENRSTNDTYRGNGTVRVITLATNPDGGESLFSEDEKVEMKNNTSKHFEYKFKSALKLGRIHVKITLTSPNGEARFDFFDETLKVSY